MTWNQLWTILHLMALAGLLAGVWITSSLIEELTRAIIRVRGAAFTLEQLADRGRLKPVDIAEESVIDDEPESLPESRFRPQQHVRVIEELNYSGGTGMVVPVGAVLKLVDCFATVDGWRWSAKWKTNHIHSIPEDMIRAVTVSELGC